MLGNAQKTNILNYLLTVSKTIDADSLRKNLQELHST